MARLMDIPLFVDNTQWYGWFPYPVQSGILQNEIDMFIYTLMEIVTQPPVGWEIMPPASYAIPVAYPEPTKFQKYGVNEIYMINLEYVEINFEEIPETNKLIKYLGEGPTDTNEWIFVFDCKELIIR